MKPVEAAWLSYARALGPVGQIQHDETRRAFYAGAFALFNSIMVQLEDGTEATADDLTLLDAVHSELTDWAAAESLRGTVPS